MSVSGYGRGAWRRNWRQIARPFGFPIGGRPPFNESGPNQSRTMREHRPSIASTIDRLADQQVFDRRTDADHFEKRTSSALQAQPFAERVLIGPMPVGEGFVHDRYGGRLGRVRIGKVAASQELKLPGAACFLFNASHSSQSPFNKL